MHWTLAVEFARNQKDVTYDEWCRLYVDMRRPTAEQIRRACETAHPILVRNNVIVANVEFDQRIR